METCKTCGIKFNLTAFVRCRHIPNDYCSQYCYDEYIAETDELEEPELYDPDLYEFDALEPDL